MGTQKIKSLSLREEALEYWEWAQKNKIPKIPSLIALEGAGSEERTPLMHFGAVAPTYLAIIKYLTENKPGKGLTLVELGCGTGRMLSYLKWKFPELEVYGVDYSKACIVYAQKHYGKFGVNFKVIEPQKTAFKDGSFDIVISSHVIEHIPKKDGISFLQETKRLLKKGGCCFIGTPERDHSQNLYHKNPEDKLKLRLVIPHEHEYTQKELEEMVSKVFESIKIDKLYNPPFFKIFSASIEKIKPGKRIDQKIINFMYQLIALKAPKRWYDLASKIGAKIKLKENKLTYKEILVENRIFGEQEEAIADNLLLICWKAK